jgi:hypothetical protein
LRNPIRLMATFALYEFIEKVPACSWQQDFVRFCDSALRILYFSHEVRPALPHRL